MQLAQLWQRLVCSMPFTYLGLPMGTTRPTVTDLMPIVKGAEHKLSSSLCVLNQGRKLTLLNSLITSLMIYLICTLKFPPKPIEHLEKIRRRCLWRKKTEQGETYNSLAASDLVCRRKKHGGMGILDIKVQNTALLLKFLHNFYSKHDVRWVDLIWSTYYLGKVPHASEACRSFWWRDIMSLGDVYRGIMKVNVGDGSTVLFWKDLWQDQITKESFARAFSYTKLEDTLVATFLYN